MDSFFMIVATCECWVFLGSTSYWIQFAGPRLMIYVLALVIWMPISLVMRRNRTAWTPPKPDLGPIPERTLAVALPENVVVHYRLAPSRARLGAAFLDLGCMVLMLTILTITFGVFVQYSMPPALRGADSMLLLAIVAALLHGFWFEYFCQGQTLGKKRFGLRVIHCSGRPLEGPEALMRSALRLPYFLPIPLAFHSFELWAVTLLPLLILELALVASSHWVQRLGDLAAGSVVIVDPR